jgi:hypothetical protein
MKNFKLTNGFRSYLIKQIKEMDLTEPKRVDIVDWKGKRGLSANGQQHVWYAQIAKHYGDRSALQVKNMCKDMFGLPILSQSAEHGDKIEFLLSKLDYYKHSYESKMKLIQCLEVTSLLNTAESKEYMEQMIFYWNEQGVNIKFKND